MKFFRCDGFTMVLFNKSFQIVRAGTFKEAFPERLLSTNDHQGYFETVIPCTVDTD
jgi:hypothetical protein